MRIALCMFGMPRSIKTGRDILGEAFINKYNPDVFVHTWMEHPYPNCYKGGYIQDTTNRIENINKIMTYYKPLSMTVDKHHIYKDWYSTEDKKPIIQAATISMFESIYLVNQLKIKYENENNMKYDVVIHCRFDFNLLTPIYFENYDMNNIYFKETGDSPQVMLNDFIFFSSSENIDILTNIYNNLKEVIYSFSNIPFTPKIWSPDPTQIHLMYNKGEVGPNSHELLARYVFLLKLSIQIIQLNMGELLRDKE